MRPTKERQSGIGRDRTCSMNQHEPLVLRVAFLALVASIIVAPGASASPLTLTIQPSSVQYASEDPNPIVLQAVLTLASSAAAPVTVCTLGGSIRVLGLKRDGALVRPVPTSVHFYAGAQFLQRQNLVSVAPGGSATIRLVLPRMPDHSAVLEEVHIPNEPLTPSGFEYVMPSPGQYTFALRYRYNGPDGGHADVFRGTVTSNTVTVTLVQ